LVCDTDGYDVPPVSPYHALCAKYKDGVTSSGTVFIKIFTEICHLMSINMFVIELRKGQTHGRGM